MSNNNQFINANIYTVDPLATLFESSTDSAVTPTEYNAMATPAVIGQRNPPPISSPLHTNGAELVTQRMQLEPHDLRQAATENAEGLTQVMRDAYKTQNNPTLYPHPPPTGDQPPRTACLAAIQAWKTQLEKQTSGEQSIRERLGLRDTELNANRSKKRCRESAEAIGAKAPATKLRRMPIGGLLNPHMETRHGDMDTEDSEIAKIMAHDEGDDTILTPKENPLPHTFPGCGQRAYHQPPGTPQVPQWPNCAADTATRPYSCVLARQEKTTSSDISTGSRCNYVHPRIGLGNQQRAYYRSNDTQIPFPRIPSSTALHHPSNRTQRHARSPTPGFMELLSLGVRLPRRATVCKLDIGSARPAKSAVPREEAANTATDASERSGGATFGRWRKPAVLTIHGTNDRRQSQLHNNNNSSHGDRSAQHEGTAPRYNSRHEHDKITKKVM